MIHLWWKLRGRYTCSSCCIGKTDECIGTFWYPCDRRVW